MKNLNHQLFLMEEWVGFFDVAVTTVSAQF